MIKYFDEEWPKEETLLKQGLDWSRQSKRERMKKVFCIGTKYIKLVLQKK
jgi:hypothetical protein